MRQVLFAVAAATLMASAAHAANVAVADPQAALWSSDVAKKAMDDLNKNTAPQRERLEKLRTELQQINERAQKDASILTDKDKQSLQAQAQSKLNEYNSTGEGLQRKVEDTQSTVIKNMKPKLEKVIEDLRVEGKYDLIIERKYAIFSAPELDLTKKIVDRLNAAK